MKQDDYEPKLDLVSDDEELLLSEVIQGEHDLYYLHHYLSELFHSDEI
jgi:hypothetical protein